MKKTLKRCLSLFLTLILLFTLAGNAFAATRDNVRQYKEYTCLGDSIATGLNYEHLDASTTFEETPGSYHSIIKQAACAKLHQYAFSGNSTKETRYIFEPDYELDEYCFWDIVGVTAEQIDGMRADIIESVRNSELITINLGSNDIFTYAMRAAFPEEETAEETNSAAAEETWKEAETTQAAPEETGTIALADESEMIAAADEEEIASEGVIFAAGAEDDFSEEAGITYEVKDEVTAETTDASSAGSLLTLLAKLIEGGRILQENYRQIIKDIRAINPDATIVIVGMYNPFRHVKFSPDSVFTGDAMGRMVVDPVNLFLYSLANSYSNVYYVDVTETETYYDIKDITMSDEEFMTYMIIDTHPTPDGHQYMADQILKVLPERTQPLVHDWMDPTYEWAEDLSSVTATRVCRNSDSHVETETAMTTAEVTKEASCEEAEETTYTAVFENEGFETKTQTVETGEPIGHVWGEPVWTWADDHSSATATFVCERDAEHKEIVPAEIITAIEDDVVIYTATVTGPDGKPYTDTVKDDMSAKRVYGSGRYETCLLIADQLKEKVGTFPAVIVASGEGFPDALAGSYLAYKVGAPILLIRNEKADMICDYIRENMAPGGMIYILGGTGVVSAAVESKLAAISEVKRLWGATRYETNLEILKEAGVSAGDEIIVCRGDDFADSLSVSSTGKAILLVDKDAGLSAAQKEYLAGLKGSRFIILSGPLVIRETVKEQLEVYGKTERIYGSRRYETSTMIAKRFFGNADRMVIAIGGNYPDGLSAGPLAAAMGAPVVLTDNGYTEWAAAYSEPLVLKEGIAIGGPLLLSDSTVMEIFKLDKATQIRVIH